MNYKHGHSTSGRRSPTMNSWHDMMRRCYNEKNRVFSSYGGRGIKVCEQWHSFNVFLKDMGDRPKLHTLDRKNNDVGYSPENCRWATKKQQARNRRTSKIIHYNGQEKCLAQWCEDLGLHYGTTVDRMNNSKWTVEKAFSTPTRR